MPQIIQIYLTTASIDEARKISRYLVQEKLAASAEIIPWIEKIVLLNGQLETMQESKLSLVALLEHFEQIKKVIIENSSYQIPEIAYRAFDFVEPSYLEWLSHRNCTPSPRS